MTTTTITSGTGNEPLSTSAMTRRRFLAGTSASVIAFSVVKPELVSGAQENSKINLGVIGCGGRGKWIADLFQKHGGYNLVALADYFQDRVDEAGEKSNVPAANRYTGLSGYRRLLEQKLDAVAIISPPYFHPEQTAAAVEAGKHIYLAKPIAVDVPGCSSIEESGRKATAKKLSFLVDFQTRANKLYQDAIALAHQGELGKLILVEANCHYGPTFTRVDQVLRQDPENPEARLRAWGLDRTLSGDIITEQNIHGIDVASWVLDAQPLRAVGTGGKTREFLGNCWDHFAVIFYYPGDRVLSFASNQAAFGYQDIMCRAFGLKGTLDTHYSGAVTLKTTDVRTSGETGSLYLDGVVTNIATFHGLITKGDCINSSVPASVRSNLTTILGRCAAYQNRVVTWDEMMRANDKLVYDLKGLKA